MALKNYHEQLNNLKKCDARINELVDFSKKLTALSVTMQSFWECNTDRERIFESFDNLIDDAETVIEWFYEFRGRATIYLNKLNTLEWIVHGQYVPWKREHASSYISREYGARKTRIQISVSEFDGFYTQLKKMADDLETVKKRTASINNNMDTMIKKQFVNGERTLINIINCLSLLQEFTIESADAVKGVGEIYKQRETDLKNFATQYMLKGQSSGTVKSSIENKFETYKGNVISGDWPESRSYTMEIGEISKYKQPQELINVMQARNSQIAAPRSEGCTYYTCDKLKILGIQVMQPFGNGKDWYDNLKSGRTLSNESKERVEISAYDGNSFWDRLLDEKNTMTQQPIYNLVISYKGVSGATASAQQYGHVLFIDAIVDGRVYYSDNYARTNYAHLLSIEEFRERYSVQHYQQQGVIHFTEK